MSEAIPVAAQARRLTQVLEAHVELHSLGGGSRTFRVTGTEDLVTVGPAWPEEVEPAAELARRAALQERIARRVSVAVPEVARLLPDLGLVVTRRIEGARLIDVAPRHRGSFRREVAAMVGTVLGELHTWDPTAYEDLAQVDDYSPEDRREETAQLVPSLAEVLDASQRQDVNHFLSRAAPPPATGLLLSHNDLGIEHVLVATGTTTPAVTGVIDWDDAAICDPAHDFGLLLRDLGPDALQVALAAYEAAGADPRAVTARAWFHARCTLLEDLAFGHAEGRPEYVEKSFTAWSPVFRTGPAA